MHGAYKNFSLNILYLLIEAGEAARDSDLIFVSKAAAASLGGAAAIKFGSLLSQAPLDANPQLAISLVVIPPTLYGLSLLLSTQAEEAP